MPNQDKLPDQAAKLVEYMRKSKGLNRRQLSEACGAHTTMLFHIEKKHRTPSLQMLDRISGALGYKLELKIKDETAN